MINVTYEEIKLIISLHKAIVRLDLEYCIQAWRPYGKKDIYIYIRLKEYRGAPLK